MTNCINNASLYWSLNYIKVKMKYILLHLTQLSFIGTICMIVNEPVAIFVIYPKYMFLFLYSKDIIFIQKPLLNNIIILGH